MEDNVNHPAHYTEGFASRPIECIDITLHLPFTLGNAVKYIWRAGKKGDREKALQDLDKAEWYIEDWRRNSWNGGPKGQPLEEARYGALDALLQSEINRGDVDYYLQTMRKEIQHGQN